MGVLDGLTVVSLWIIVGAVGALDFCAQWFSPRSALPSSRPIGILVGALALGGPFTFICAGLSRAARRRVLARRRAR